MSVAVALRGGEVLGHPFSISLMSLGTWRCVCVCPAPTPFPLIFVHAGRKPGKAEATLMSSPERRPPKRTVPDIVLNPLHASRTWSYNPGGTGSLASTRSSNNSNGSRRVPLDQVKLPSPLGVRARRGKATPRCTTTDTAAILAHVSLLGSASLQSSSGSVWEEGLAATAPASQPSLPLPDPLSLPTLPPLAHLDLATLTDTIIPPQYHQLETVPHFMSTDVSLTQGGVSRRRRWPSLLGAPDLAADSASLQQWCAFPFHDCLTHTQSCALCGDLCVRVQVRVADSNGSLWGTC